MGGWGLTTLTMIVSLLPSMDPSPRADNDGKTAMYVLKEILYDIYNGFSFSLVATPCLFTTFVLLINDRGYDDGYLHKDYLRKFA